MFNSKSKLTASEAARLNMECQGAVDWIIANRTAKNGFISLPCRADYETETAVYDLHLPLKYLGGGAYGRAYAMKNWPGLVLKLCTDKTDLYPEYIRAIAELNLKDSMLPRVFAHGGDELNGVFWCVLPEYKQIDDYQKWDGGSWSGEDAFVGTIKYVVDAVTMAALVPAVRSEFDWDAGGVIRLRADRGLSKKQRRTVRKLRMVMPHIHKLTSYGYDLHMYNVMMDGGKPVITDPFGGIDRFNNPDLEGTKHAVRAIFKW